MSDVSAALCKDTVPTSGAKRCCAETGNHIKDFEALTVSILDWAAAAALKRCDATKIYQMLWCKSSLHVQPDEEQLHILHRFQDSTLTKRNRASGTVPGTAAQCRIRTHGVLRPSNPLYGSLAPRLAQQKEEHYVSRQANKQESKGAGHTMHFS